MDYISAKRRQQAFGVARVELFPHLPRFPKTETRLTV